MIVRRTYTGCERRSWFLTKMFGLAGVLALAATGCEPPMSNVLVDADGKTIRLDAITAVLDDTDLTEEGKRQALRDLGISDEALIDALLRGGL